MIPFGGLPVLSKKICYVPGMKVKINVTSEILKCLAKGLIFKQNIQLYQSYIT